VAAAVVDANIAVALLVRLPYSPQADQLFLNWNLHGVAIYAPSLWLTEIISSLRKIIAVGQITEADAVQCIDRLLKLSVQVVEPTGDLLKSSLGWADKIHQSVAYDAQYLALAESLKADFWTADRRLYNSAQQAGANRVHWLGEITTSTVS
jgi:predicted nucleic acid-binding protein